MRNRDELVGNAETDNRRYCLARAGELYLVYLPEGGTAELDLSEAAGEFDVRWFNPRTGGALSEGEIRRVSGGGQVMVGAPPSAAGEDWLVVLRKREPGVNPGR